MIYLDYAAGTPIEHIMYNGQSGILNPNAGYSAKQKVKISQLKSDMLKSLWATSGRIEFGPNASAICQFLANRAKMAQKICISDEHECVINIVDAIVNSEIEQNKVLEEFTGSPRIFFRMAVNNVTGKITNFAKLGAKVQELVPSRKTNNFVAVDLTAAIPYFEWARNMFSLIDVAFASTSKIGTEQGMGFIWMSDRFCKRFGINDERPLITGTPNLRWIENIADLVYVTRANDGIYDRQHYEEFELYLDELLLRNNLIKKRFLKPKYMKVSGINPVILDGLNADAVQQYLAGKDIYIGVGHSSCEANGDFRVLKAQGYSLKDANNTIRVSFGPDTTKESIEALVEAIVEFKEKFA